MTLMLCLFDSLEFYLKTANQGNLSIFEVNRNKLQIFGFVETEDAKFIFKYA